MRQRGKCGVTRQAQVPRRSLGMLAEGGALPRRMELPGPTSGASEPSLRRFYIRRIRGLAFASAVTSRSRSRMALSFAVACTAASLRFRLVCSTDLHAPGYALRLMRMSSLRHWRLRLSFFRSHRPPKSAEVKLSVVVTYKNIYLVMDARTPAAVFTAKHEMKAHFRRRLRQLRRYLM
jgi:hypothetical protein